MSAPENLLTDWSTLLFATLADVGVTDIVLSPGSRSTPFALAAMRERRLRCHTVIDERAAGFFALGQARLTERPSVLLCTSGSAAAHYFPAIVEAAAAHVPLLAITADRPTELQACAAPQTIDQIKMFGDYARGFFDLGMPDPAPGILRGLRRMIAQAVHATMQPVPGPVHINARARKPLEPKEPSSPEGLRLRADVEAILAQPVVTVRAPSGSVSTQTIDELMARLGAAKRGLIVCGPAPIAARRTAAAVFALARATGFALLSEATSQLRFGDAPGEGVVVCDAFDAIVRSAWFREHAVPDVIVEIGSPATSSAWEQWLGRGVAVDRIVLGAQEWSDPHSSARTLVVGDVGESVAALARAARERLQPVPEARSAYAAALGEANRRARAAASEQLAASTELGEGEATRTTIDRAPNGSLLVVGNSLAVRHLDTWVPSVAKDLDVVCQRGANGIDGFLASTFGAATVTERPITLLIGDVSFLHDLNSLMLGRELRAPVVMVVVQNNGGRIFETLPLGRLLGPEARELEPVITPHTFELSHAAAMFGHAYNLVRTRGELESALDAAYRQPRCTVLEVVVPPHGAAVANDRLFANVAESIASLRA